LAQAFAVGAWITSMLALTSCFYVSVRPIPEEGMPELPTEGFGWMSRQIEVNEPPAYGKQCAWYTAEERRLYFDSMWNAGFAMALITVLVGVVVMSTVLCTCCVAFQLPTFDGLFWTCTVCFVAQCLSFLTWGSELCTSGEMECTWSSGTGMNLTAAMMWVWAANMIKSFPEALPARTRGRHHVGEDGDHDGGDVYLSNTNLDNTNRSDVYREDEYGESYYEEGGQDNGDGYYDEEGNWINNETSYHDRYDDNYDDFDGQKGSMHSNSGYSDYDNQSSNWAEEDHEGETYDEDMEEDQPKKSTRKSKSKRKKKKKKPRDGVSSSSMASFDNDDWDDERGSFRY